MASLYSLFGKTQSERVKDADVALAVEVADELVELSTARIAPIEAKMIKAEAKRDKWHMAWLEAGKPWDGEIFQKMVKWHRKAIMARADFEYWNPIHLDHQERRWRLNEYEL
ncbi:hypothetical protein BH762_gp049 [Gordonia phage OneUp]|uniref:Uncharacterized protein n=1 Tax=Gordonia phage OneUp TaxID=1838074 RepID=A0A160DF12_9CAUD|nr:hypothetical protein BH762_gp049 [Gordonia phage OneUp]ANA86469.1 hypothetical protein PBI_ONEUP_136 [Gordonia phage OneUp]